MAYKDTLIESFNAAVPLIVKVQQALIDGKEEVELNGSTHKIVLATKPKEEVTAAGSAPAPLKKAGTKDKTALSVADARSQEIILQTLADRLTAAGHKVSAVAEEEGVDKIKGLVPEAASDIRVIVDPIDGTSNYLEKLRSNMEESPDGKGWGSMIAIQELQPDKTTWKTVASGIYESSEKDTPEKLTGRLFITEGAGTEIIKMDTGETTKIDPQTISAGNKHVIGGFIENAARAPLDVTMRDLASQELDLSCVAQSALSVITGKTQAYYQEHPNLHDVAAIASLAENAGLFVAVMPILNPGMDGKPTDKIVDGKDRYPIIMTRDPELGIKLVAEYAKAKGYDLETTKFRRGDFTEASFAELAQPRGMDTAAATVETLRATQIGRTA